MPQEVVCLSFPLKIQHKSESHPRKLNIYVKPLQLNKPINIPINEFNLSEHLGENPKIHWFIKIFLLVQMVMYLVLLYYSRFP